MNSSRTGATARATLGAVLALVVLAACSADGATPSPPVSNGVDSTVVDTGVVSASSAPPATDPAGSQPPSSTESAAVDDDVPLDEYVPTAEWETTALPAGVDSAALDAAVDAAFGDAANPARVRSIVVVLDGRIAVERYHPLDGPDDVMESFSVAKSITSAAIGLAVGDGLLATEAPAPVEQWDAGADPRAAITVEHLLHMASGLSWDEQYGPGSPPLEMLASPSAADYAAGLPLEHEPGTVFEYSTGTTAILAGVLADVLGGPEAADRYLQERLFGAIGMSSTRLLRDSSGVWVGGLGADSTTRDFARFGLLFARDGWWGTERVLPAGWVDYSCSPSPANPEYGAQWWIRDDGACTARGLFGQVVLVDREADLVIAVNTAPGGDADTLVDAVVDLMRSGLGGAAGGD